MGLTELKISSSLLICSFAESLHTPRRVCTPGRLFCIGSPRARTFALTSGAIVRSRRTCVTWARVTPSLSARSAPDADSPESIRCCHAWARTMGLQYCLAEVSFFSRLGVNQSRILVREISDGIPLREKISRIGWALVTYVPMEPSLRF